MCLSNVTQWRTQDLTLGGVVDFVNGGGGGGVRNIIESVYR